MKSKNRLQGLVIAFILFFSGMIISIASDEGHIAGVCLFMLIVCGAGMMDYNTQKQNKHDRGLFLDKIDDCELD